MEAQYRCKCGKAMSYPKEQCPDCGSLGPHAFMGKSVPVAESTDIPRPARHKESYTPEYVEQPQPAARPERHPVPPADDIPPEPRHSGGRVFEEDDSRFPAGMRSHSPILDHIRNLDGENKETKKRSAKEKPSVYEEREDRHADYSYGSDEESEHAKAQPQPSGSGGLVSTIISVLLVLALVIAAIYVINNYEEITKWLASPTVPEVFKPSAE